jgi:hypothetical protein
MCTGLMAEDDENCEIWFLMGAAFFKMEPPDLGYARMHLEKASEMLEKIRTDMMKSAKKQGGAAAVAQFQFPYEEQSKLVADQLVLVSEAENDPQLAAMQLDDADSNSDSDIGGADSHQDMDTDAAI